MIIVVTERTGWSAEARDPEVLTSGRLYDLMHDHDLHATASKVSPGFA